MVQSLHGIIPAGYLIPSSEFSSRLFSHSFSQKLILPEQQLFLLPVCPAGLYFTSWSDVAVSGKNHYNKQVDIVMLKIHLTDSISEA